ncbi:MAG: hypothetical protein GX996_04600 [Firmicutes bacterium]|nr:hypothetical protein [Bacillota bacterium]
MPEKLKSLLLVCLILLSVALTYHLWFGSAPLEKGIVPRYEHAYFTSPPAPSEIILPSEIIFLEQDTLFVFHRGERQYRSLWRKGLQLLTEKVTAEEIKHISSEKKEELLKNSFSTLVYNFRPSLLLENIASLPASMHAEIDKITFSWDEDQQLNIFLAGDEIIHIPEKEAVHLKDEFLPVEGNPYALLPPFLYLNTEDMELIEAPLTGDLEDAEIEDPDNVEIIEGISEEIYGARDETWNNAQNEIPEKTNSDEDPDDFEDTSPFLNLEVNVISDIYVPLEEIYAAEVFLKKEELQQEQLVRTFFLDLSMARRIEERDGALYFTNGEKGLRLYPSGLLEYTAPQLERTQDDMSYGAALQESAESQSLYGGWLPHTYLYKAEKSGNGYRFLWRSYREGYALVGGNMGSEMIINKQGVLFYRRFFYIFGEDASELRPFRSYKEAIVQSLLLNYEQLKGGATLLSMEPVYYLPEGRKPEKAVPAWHINFAETGDVYLHWRTLEPVI